MLWSEFCIWELIWRSCVLHNVYILHTLHIFILYLGVNRSICSIDWSSKDSGWIYAILKWGVRRLQPVFRPSQQVTRLSWLGARLSRSISRLSRPFLLTWHAQSWCGRQANPSHWYGLIRGCLIDPLACKNIPAQPSPNFSYFSCFIYNI